MKIKLLALAVAKIGILAYFTRIFHIKPRYTKRLQVSAPRHQRQTNVPNCLVASYYWALERSASRCKVDTKSLTSLSPSIDFNDTPG